MTRTTEQTQTATTTAVVRDRYGDHTRLASRTQPTPQPAEGKVLVRVLAAGVNPLDRHTLSGTPWIMRMSTGLRRPKQAGLGTDLAGIVAAIGPGVTAWAPGDRVFGFGDATFATHAIAGERGLVALPDDQAAHLMAAIPVAGVTAAQALDAAGVGAGSTVLVLGASGGVGTMTVQLAVARGATVTGVCSTANVELVRSLGATHVLDRTTSSLDELTDRYDAIIDNAGAWPLRVIRRRLTETGAYVVVGGPDGGRLIGPLRHGIKSKLAFAFRSQRAIVFMARLSGEAVTALRDLVVSGQLTPVVSATYPLERAAEALRVVAAGHTRGKIVIQVADDDPPDDAPGVASATE